MAVLQKNGFSQSDPENAHSSQANDYFPIRSLAITAHGPFVLQFTTADASLFEKGDFI